MACKFSVAATPLVWAGSLLRILATCAVRVYSLVGERRWIYGESLYIRWREELSPRPHLRRGLPTLYPEATLSGLISDIHLGNKPNAVDERYPLDAIIYLLL